MTDFGQRPGDMFKAAYDANADDVVDSVIAHKATHQNGGTDEISASGLAGVGVTDHGALTGNPDDDHDHYHNDARGDARYVQLENMLVNWALADQYKQIIQGTWLAVRDLDYDWRTKFRNSSRAINDEIEYELFAQDGSRTFEIFTQTEAMACIITVYLDDVSQGTIDTWSNPLVKNVYKTLAVTVVTTAKHSVKLKAASKNPFSSGYYLYIAWVRIK